MIEPAKPKAYLLLFGEERNASTKTLTLRGRCYSLNAYHLDIAAPHTARDKQFDYRMLERLKAPVDQIVSDERGQIAHELIDHESTETQQRCVLIPVSRYDQLVEDASKARGFSRRWKNLAKTYFNALTGGPV